MHEANCFVTLTYAPEHLPSDGGLVKRHWQLFAKRLRKRIGPFRYFHSGEYGSAKHTRRPHFHAAIFGHDFRHDREHRATRKGFPVYSSPTLNDSWSFGLTELGSLTPASARYIAKYVTKRLNGKATDSHYERVDPSTGEVHQVIREYATMSRMPGIGFGYYEQFREELARDGVCRMPDATIRPIPTYYENLLKRDDPEAYARLRKAKLERIAEQESDQTPDRLKVRQRCAEAYAARQRKNEQL